MLSRDERDAELLIAYLASVDADPGCRVTPPSSGLGGPLAAENEAAWLIVRRDWRFLALDFTPLAARMMAGTWSRAVRAQWNPRLHPRDAGGEWAAAGVMNQGSLSLLGPAKGHPSGQPYQPGSGSKGTVKDRYYVPPPGPDEVQQHVAEAHGAGPGFGRTYPGQAALTPAEMLAHHEHQHQVPGQNHHHGAGRS